MKRNTYFSMTIIAVAILSGCATPHNASLTEAHSSYDSARVDPNVANLAALELKEAGDSLNKADAAFSHGENDTTVNQLAYIAKKQVGIAQEVAKQKSAELTVSNAGARRDQIRLEARTAEADAAIEQVAIIKEVADWQAEDLAAASAIEDSDKALIFKQETQLKELNAQKTKRGMVITLGDVLFGDNQAHMSSGGTRNVQMLADFLKQYKQLRVMIEGHTDSIGSNDRNQKLSERRASAVKTALVDMGINTDRVITRGYGEAFPVSSNENVSGRQMNRRVEIIFSDDQGNIVPR